MTTFADIVDAAGGLSAEEQLTLIQILQRRLVDENRQRLLREVEAARDEHATGASSRASVADLMDEIRRDA